MRLLKLALVLGGACALGGCLTSTDDPYPMTGDPVNPTPGRGYKVQCNTSPWIPNLFADDLRTHCRQIIAPAADAVVAKG